MSITIGGKFKVITEDFINDFNTRKQIHYNLLKEKYNIDNNIKHFYKELIKLFYKYNNNLSYENNLGNFIEYIEYLNSGISINEYIEHNIHNKLKNTVSTFYNLENSYDLIDMLEELTDDNLILKNIIKKIKNLRKNNENIINRKCKTQLNINEPESIIKNLNVIIINEKKDNYIEYDKLIDEFFNNI